MHFLIRRKGLCDTIVGYFYKRTVKPAPEEQPFTPSHLFVPESCIVYPMNNMRQRRNVDRVRVGGDLHLNHCKYPSLQTHRGALCLSDVALVGASSDRYWAVEVVGEQVEIFI